MIKTNFDEIYSKITTSGVEMQLSELRKKTNLGFFLFIGSVIINICAYAAKVPAPLIIALFICMFGALIYYIIQSNNYKKQFKSLIIGRLVEEYNPDLRFSPNSGISDFDYRQGHYELFDRYHAEDLVYGKIAGSYDFKMSEVKTEKEEITRDSEGKERRSYRTMFQGMFGVVELRGSIPMKMDIKSNSFVNRYNKSRIEVDSAEFEKDYDMFATDKVRAMEIFTSELIEEFNRYQDETGYNIQIKVMNDRLFFRIASGSTFEAPMLKDAMSRDYLYKNYQMVDYPVTIISKMIENATTTKI